MTTHFFGDTAVLLGRTLRHITRSPDTIITTAIMPIAFMLLFVYVFGGAIQHGSGIVCELPAARHPAHHDRVGHLLHRIPALHGHAGRHLRAIPVHADRTVVRAVGARADLAGRQSDLARGRRGRRRRSWASARAAGVLAWLAVAGILILFTLALTWIAVIPGLTAKTVDGAGAFAYPLIFLPFISSAFVPTAHHARPGARLRRQSAGDLHRQHDPRPVHPAAGRHRHLDRPRLVPRHPRRRVRPRHGHLPPQDRLRIRLPDGADLTAAAGNLARDRRYPLRICSLMMSAWPQC